MSIIILKNHIASSFSKGELRSLCFDLGINYENLSGETLENKTVELVSHCQRHGHLPSLVRRCHELRPHINWSEELYNFKKENFNHNQHYLLGIDYFRRNYHNEAINHLIIATNHLKSGKKRTECYLNLSRSASILGNNLMSFKYAEKAIIDSSKIADRYSLENHAWAFIRQGDAKKKLAEYNSALDDYKYALSISEKEIFLARVHSVALERIGDVFGKKGEWKQALLNFNLDLKIRYQLLQTQANPQIARDYVIANQRRGNSLAKLKEFDEAIEMFNEAAKHANELIKYDGENSGWHWDLSNALRKKGEVLLKLGKISEAEYYLQEALNEVSISCKIAPKNKRYSDGKLKSQIALNKLKKVSFHK